MNNQQLSANRLLPLGVTKKVAPFLGFKINQINPYVKQYKYETNYQSKHASFRAFHA